MDAFYLITIRNEIKKNNHKTKEKNIKNNIPTKEIIKRNKSIDNFIKFSWPWIN